MAAPTMPPSPAANPYMTLLNETAHDPDKITQAYATHRTNRAAAQLALLTGPDSPGLIPDPILTALAAAPESTDPATLDPRHNMPYWARPPARVRALIASIQSRLHAALPDLYLPQQAHLHLTVMETTHSQPATALAPLIAALDATGATAQIADMPAMLARAGRIARLACPMVTYDAHAVALSFLPVRVPSAAEPPTTSTTGDADVDSLLGESQEQFTYHHLRGAVYAAAAAAVPIASRYVLPSAHITIARFIGSGSGSTDTAAAAAAARLARAQALIGAIDAANAWLEARVWGDRGAGAVWDVGEERGLELRAGSCWYGFGGRSVRVGRGVRGCVVRAHADADAEGATA